MNISRRLLALALLLPAGAGNALEQDRDQPLKVNAANVTMNEKTGVAVYRGNVVVMQGSMRVEADYMEVRTRDFQIHTLTATGRPVRVRALLDNHEDELQASADRVVVHATTRELDLSGHVQLRQGGDQFNAEQLHYALDEKRMTAKGDDTEDGRIYAIIQPARRNKNP